MGRVNCTENVWLSKVPLVPLRQPFCEKQGFGKSPWLRESVLRKKNRPRFLREHLLGNCRAPHARRHGRAVRVLQSDRPTVGHGRWAPTGLFRPDRGALTIRRHPATPHRQPAQSVGLRASRKVCAAVDTDLDLSGVRLPR